LVPRIKVWLELGGRYAFGLGLVEMLQAVDRSGSIKRAAAALGKSYRHVWGRIKEAEDTLGQQLVETQVGGRGSSRSTLTPWARQLVSGFLAWRSQTFEDAAEEFARHFDFPSAVSSRSNPPPFAPQKGVLSRSERRR
jgi:molybdate transport system regulatory protein